MTQVEYVDIKKLTLLKNNPRSISKEEFARLCNSLQEDEGFFDARPVLINRKDQELHVYAGNQRVRAAEKLGWVQVPCIIEEDIDPEIIKKRIIIDNRHAGDWDYDELANSYDIDMLLDCGFKLSDFEIDIPEIIETEEDGEVLEPGKDEEAETKLGDIYDLNGHRLACGDSTDPEIVQRLLLSETPVLMVTDPPYGVNYDANWRQGALKDGGKRAKGKVQNDDQVNWALAWHLFPGSVAYTWCASWFLTDVAKSLDDSEFERKSLIIWVKQHFALSRGDYHWQHEPCWYAVKKGHSHNWQGSRKEATTWEISNLNCFGKSKEDGEERTAHSTQKPIECMAKPIRNNTAKGEGVYDPFLGSGTTLIAAEQLGRICYGIELSPAYCDIIVNRWKNLMIKNGKEFTIKKNGEAIDVAA